MLSSSRPKNMLHSHAWPSYHLKKVTSDMKEILLTGFGPYGSFTRNPAQYVAECLNGAVISQAHVNGLPLPVEYGADTSLVFEAVKRHQPDAVVCLGLDDEAHVIFLEEVAGNHRELDDGSGLVEIIESAPQFLKVTIPARDITAELRIKGFSAATRRYVDSVYFCNHILYNVLYAAATSIKPYCAGFVHLPTPTDWGGAKSSLTSDQLVEAIRVVIAHVARAY